MKVLVSAYGCEPGKGSESGVGWYWVKELSKKYELWVITRSNNKSVIENYPEQFRNVTWIYYDKPVLSSLFKRGAKGLYLYYLFWQIGILKIAKKLQKENNFDYCMHLSFGSMWMPTFMYKLDCPFVWGPIGGGETIPKQYWKMFSFKERTSQRIREALIKLSSLNPFLGNPLRKADKVITRTIESKNVFPKKYHKKVLTTLETCIDDEVLGIYQEPLLKKEEVMELVYFGRLMSIKALDIGMKALSRSKYKDYLKLTIIGKGPEEVKLRKLANDLEISNNVIFMGQQTRSDTLDFVSKSDVFLFPSLKEGGTWSLMEAMALGKVCICHDRTGMHEIVDKESGILIKANGVEHSINQFKDALDYLYENPVQRINLGNNAHNRIKEFFTWDKKGEWIRREL